MNETGTDAVRGPTQASLSGRGGGSATAEDLRLANLARLGRFLHRGIVHDLRSPLNALALQLDVLSHSLEHDDPGDPAARRAHADAVRDIRRGLSRFAESLPAAFSQPGLDPEERKPLDLRALLGTLVKCVRPEAQVRGVRIRTEAAGDPVPVYGDESRLMQAFLNLVANAFEAMPGGGTVRIAAEVDGEQALVLIEDQGPGIAPDPAGLYVARSILRAHGGDLRIRSREGEGAATEILLPIHPAGEGPSDADRTSHR